jgi:hypothetical protein
LSGRRGEHADRPFADAFVTRGATVYRGFSLRRDMKRR